MQTIVAEQKLEQGEQVAKAKTEGQIEIGAEQQKRLARAGTLVAVAALVEGCLGRGWAQWTKGFVLVAR